MPYNHTAVSDTHPGLQATKERRILSGLTINAANTDIGQFANLPGKYRVLRVMAFQGSADLSLSLATIGVFTAAAGGGTAVVAAAVITGLTASTKFADMTVATSADYLTAGTLFVRNGVANGSAATISVLLEIMDLTGA